MSKVVKVCEEHEVFGARKTTCHYELEELNADELFEQIKDAIEDGLDYVPGTFTYVYSKCLDAECYDTEEIEFEIDVREYLSDEDIEELEKLVEIDDE